MTDEKTVYIAVPGSTNKNVYHLYTDCQALSGKTRTKQITESEAENRGLRVCGSCNGGVGKGMASEVYQAAVNAEVDVFE